jgi:acetylxylan esterase
MLSLKASLLLFLSQVVTGFPVGNLEERACPGIHIFGARETTASPGYGSAGTVRRSILLSKTRLSATQSLRDSSMLTTRS